MACNTLPGTECLQFNKNMLYWLCVYPNLVTATKVLKTPTLAERQLRLTQTVTQSGSAPNEQLGHNRSA